MLVFAAISIYAPDAESKMMVMYDNYRLIASMGYAALFGLMCLVTGLIFLTARCSPPACIMIAIGFAAGLKVTMFDMATMRGTMFATALNQLRIGREILGATRTDLTPVVDCRPVGPEAT